MILSGGQNIFPGDIEDVAQGTVIGIPHSKWDETPLAKWDETPLAVVIPRENVSINVDSLAGWATTAHLWRGHNRRNPAQPQRQGAQTDTAPK
jgi:acyl-CoA synthetase (AMP-forming)/AMP-acid ligase II